jgi:hypothetical protein
LDNQTWVALGFEIQNLRDTAEALTREKVADDDVLYRAVTAFNAVTGGEMLFKAEMTPQRRRLICELLCSVYTLVETSDDGWVRRDLASLAEKLVWKDERVRVA